MKNSEKRNKISVLILKDDQERDELDQVTRGNRRSRGERVYVEEGHERNER